MKNMMKLAAAMVLALGLSAAPAFAGHHENPCNPCAMKKMEHMNPCNPCAMKKMEHMNPCNPCAMKKMEHMNPCNPCDMKHGKKHD